MNYFSRLTDIVTCSLTEILAKEAEPAAAIVQIIREIEEGLSGAQRSVKTAAANEERIRKELDEHKTQAEMWQSKAREELQGGSESGARLALIRKREVDDLNAGLEQQHSAAVATRDHMGTMLHALEARLAEARRKQQQLEAGTPAKGSPSTADITTAVNDSRAEQIEQDLEALKHELGQ